MALIDNGILRRLMFIYLIDLSLGIIINDLQRIPTTISLFDLQELKIFLFYQIISFDHIARNHDEVLPQVHKLYPIVLSNKTHVQCDTKSLH
jgi:hypothetical protein